ncbi:S8 family serine peptidase [Clostridium sp. YIM B02555]|uniref:S8 family serine peptidase n=1 Tax=Clostridium sp. YIM B02555 TaxID=2911968 RepID=UPI001EEDFF0D|nr:S8 family serine peptidase [Clostridium sp. YIM B02555]
MKRIKVAIIDDGIDRVDFNKDRIIECYNVKNKKISYLGKHGEEISGSSTGFRHGTLCEEVFAHFVHTYEYDLYSINIFECEGEINIIDNLLEAIRWCIENKVEVINMSIGTTNFAYFKIIEEAIELLVKQGAIIVAAESNENRLTYPACLPKVIGVRCSRGVGLRPNEYIYNVKAIDGIEVIAFSSYDGKELEHKLTDGSLLVSEMTKCNSFTAPFITAKVCELIKRGIRGVEDIKHELLVNANYINDSIDKFIILGEDYYDCLDSDEEIQMPNIVIYNEAEININIIIESLRTYFIEDNYNSIAISRIGESSIENGIYVLERNDSDIYILDKVKMLYKFTNPDVLITEVLHINEIQQLKENGLVDIVIYFYKNEINKDLLNSYENLISMNLIERNNLSDQERTRLIYNRCIDLFESIN